MPSAAPSQGFPSPLFCQMCCLNICNLFLITCAAQEKIVYMLWASLGLLRQKFVEQQSSKTLCQKVIGTWCPMIFGTPQGKQETKVWNTFPHNEFVILRLNSLRDYGWMCSNTVLNITDKSHFFPIHYCKQLKKNQNKRVWIMIIQVGNQDKVGCRSDNYCEHLLSNSDSYPMLLSEHQQQ